MPGTPEQRRSRQNLPVIERCDPEQMPDILNLLDLCGLPIDDVSLESQSIFTARDGVRLMGCCGFEMHGSIALLRSFAIRPEDRSLPLARRLIGYVIWEAIQGGARTLILLTATLPEAVLRRFHFEKRDRKDFDCQMSGARGWELSRGSGAALYTREIRVDGTREGARNYRTPSGGS